ncbi:MAG TPA: amidohydrolase family protein [Trebonia sp.]
MAAAIKITNVRVFTGSGLSSPGQVVIEQGILTADGPADSVLDGSGRVLLPGLIDAHMHTRSWADLQQLAGWGVTTGLDMASWPAEFVNQMRAQAGVADIRSSAIPAVGPGGSHAKLPGFPAEGIVTTPGEGRAFVAQRVADGADYIKIVTEAAPPAGMDQATVDAIVNAAHEHGLLVVAHSVTTGAFHVAIEAGVDVSTHAPIDAVLDDDAVQRMRDAGMVSVPTLTMMECVAPLRAAMGLRYENARDTVTKFHQAGIPVLAGTDANSATGVPASPKHGESLHHELELLVAAGLSPAEALRGATAAVAEVFGLRDRGVIAPGKRADLLLVDGDPTADITATHNIAAVWIAGERVK